jgi:uncharacterized protein (TIGR00304 family)
VIDSGVLYALGVALVFVGVLIIVIAVILLFVSNAGKGEAKGAGVIIIGPVPIVFGTDKKSVKTLLFFLWRLLCSLWLPWLCTTCC